MVSEGAWEWLHLFRIKNMTPNVNVYYYNVYGIYCSE